MPNYYFADLHIEMNCTYEIMKRRAKKYLTTKTIKNDVSIIVPEKVITQPSDRYHHLPSESIELILMGNRFARDILLYDGFVLHSSAIAFANKGILFSADSGIGKSTHTRLWQKHFGTESVPILNDDKPAIRRLDDRFYVYGTPFSGNSEENRNMKVPLHAIVFLERADDNSIRRISPAESLPLLMRHTLRPGSSQEHMTALLALLDELLSEIPVYVLRCNMDEEAAVVAAEGIL